MEIEPMSIDDFNKFPGTGGTHGKRAGRKRSETRLTIEAMELNSAIIISHGLIRCFSGQWCGIRQMASLAGKNLNRIYETHHLSDGRVAIACRVK